MKTLSIDIETFSSVDLAKCGVYKYAEAPDFEILLFGYSVDGGAVQVVDLASGEKIPFDVLAAFVDETVIKWAFNANFERVCISRYMGMPPGDYLDPTSWRCSMVWSAYMGLPQSLAEVGEVLGLEKQKLTEGKDLIRYFCVPCKPTAFFKCKDGHIHVSCGCFSGTLAEFEAKVKDTHGDSKYAKEYLACVEAVKIHFEIEKGRV